MGYNPLALAVVLAAMSGVISLFKWSAAADTVPVFWNGHAQPILWVPKFVGLTILPVLEIVIPYIIYQIVARDSDIENQGAESKHAVAHLITLPALFLFFVHNFVLIDAATSEDHVFNARSFVCIVALWLLFWFGHIVQYLEFNSAVGIITPWTKNNTTVWEKTHAHAGWVLQISGVFLVGSALLVPFGIPFLVVSLVLFVGPFIYLVAFSYFVTNDSASEPLLSS